MPGRPRTHHGGSDAPDDGSTPSHHSSGGAGGSHHSVAEAQRAAAQVAHQGRAGNRAPNAPSGGVSGSHDSQSPATHPSDDDIELAKWEDQYEKLGDRPQRFNVATNDAAHDADGAHTTKRHNPDIPIRRDPNVKTIEGRIYGDEGWSQPANASFRWTDDSTMNRTINDHVSQNWEQIRNSLAISGRYVETFDAGHRVGEGYLNTGMGGAGPRQAQYATTSVVRITMQLVPGSDPPEPYIVTAFPAALG